MRMLFSHKNFDLTLSKLYTSLLLLQFTFKLTLQACPKAHAHMSVGGTLQDAMLHKQTPSNIKVAAAPKSIGAQHLHLVASLMPTSFIGLFSSTAAIFGPPGQANYAAANAQLDAMASCCQSMGK